jgi:hypothetical protein
MVADGSCDHSTEAAARTIRAATYRFRVKTEMAVLATGNISNIASRVDPQAIRRTAPELGSVSTALLPPTAKAPFGEKIEKAPWTA